LFDRKCKVEARMVEANGFEPSSDDAKLLAKGFEKLIIPMEKAFNVFAIVNCHWSLKSRVLVWVSW
jgi:hypothetical protein